MFCDIFSTTPSPWVAPILVIIGWYIVSSQNNQRERRKEARLQIDAIRKRLEEIEISATRYHTEPSPNSHASLTIKNALKEISQQLQHLDFAETKELSRKFNSFKKAITIRNFDTSTFRKQDTNSDFFVELFDARIEICNQLERDFKNQYSSAFITRIVNYVRNLISKR